MKNHEHVLTFYTGNLEIIFFLIYLLKFCFIKYKFMNFFTLDKKWHSLEFAFIIKIKEMPLNCEIFFFW